MTAQFTSLRQHQELLVQRLLSRSQGSSAHLERKAVRPAGSNQIWSAAWMEPMQLHNVMLRLRRPRRHPLRRGCALFRTDHNRCRRMSAALSHFKSCCCCTSLLLWGATSILGMYCTGLDIVHLMAGSSGRACLTQEYQQGMLLRAPALCVNSIISIMADASRIVTRSYCWFALSLLGFFVSVSSCSSHDVALMLFISNCSL